MDVYYENIITIQAHEVDFMNRLRADSLFMLLQDTAASHADKADLGYTSLSKHNLAWVLSWAKVEVEELPGFGEKIRIATWPKKRYKLYVLRDFYVYKNDKIIVRAATAWLPINIKSKRIIDSTALPVPIQYLEQSAIDEIPKKVVEQQNKEFVLTRKMRYSDIDLNQHVNNIHYIELIMDSFDKNKYEKSGLKSLEVNFISESIYNDEIEIYKSCPDVRLNIIECINKINSKMIFQAKVEWQEWAS